MSETSTVNMSLSFGESLRQDRHNRAPDVLNTIANLSSDEVFTPPEFANRMLDTLAEAWAADNGGALIWADPDVTFLDPATKSGVFLREITKRLVQGQGNPAEGSAERKALVDRVLTKQVFGLGMTSLTALLARRSLYCSKDATGEHSIATSFDRPWGNIWFERTEHEWTARKRERRVDPISAEEVLVELPGTGRCKWCPAAEQSYGRGSDLETHAYALLHTDDPQRLVSETYGGDMHFDVIIGNPPYQLGAQKDDSTERLGRVRDVPIYQRFIQAAKALEPRYLTMVTPSRWFAGGLGLSEFRDEMLRDHRIRNVVDFPASGEVFPGVDISGGVSYFLWDASHSGGTSVMTVRGENAETAERDLSEFDIFVRDARSAAILRKVLALREPSIRGILSADKEFGWTSNFDGFHFEEKPGDVPIHYNRKGKRLVGYISRGEVAKSAGLIDTWKVMVPSAGFEHGGGDGKAMRVLSTPFITPSPSVCTQTYLFFRVTDRAEAESLRSYLGTRFLRFLVSLRKITQHASPATYTWVPMQPWDRLWTDAELYAKYLLTEEEVAYIESMIKPMDLSLSSDED